MTTEYTRENRIKKLDLKIKLLTVHLSALLIFLTLSIFVIGSTAYELYQKFIILAVSCGAILFIMKSLLDGYKEIDDIFKD